MLLAKDISSNFPLGTLVATPNALQSLNSEDMYAGLLRHAKCDWGDLSEEDRLENEFSLTRRLRLLSSYTDQSGTKFWIITEADRSMTTILLPEDY